MWTVLVVHVVSGAVALLAGFVALYAAKGARMHRRSGTTFAAAMLVMCGAGLAVSLAHRVALATNVPAALLTATLVVTALTTVRPPSPATRRLDRVATVVTGGVAAACWMFAAQAVAAGGTRDGMPAFPFVMFGVVATLATAGDLRLRRTGSPVGRRRLARHLWRMSFALFIAALSFFIGQADELPAALRIMPLLAVPPLAVLTTMVYWLWRVRRRRGTRGVELRGAADAA